MQPQVNHSKKTPMSSTLPPKVESMATLLENCAPNPPLSVLPSRMHHRAFVVQDQEVTRKFFEDLLGIPLTATWIEESFNADLGRKQNFCHTFYSFGDGSALSFFQFETAAAYELFKAPKLKSISYDHLALKVSLETLEEIDRRLAAAQYPHKEIHHGYCRSLYVSSPDDLTLEFTYDPPNAVEIQDTRTRADPHRELQEWLKGDRTTNNTWRGQALH